MCDREHCNIIRGRLDRVEDNMIEYHAKTDERIKTLFQTCAELSSTAKLTFRWTMGVITFIVVVAVLALIYGAVGDQGFNAVTRAARHKTVSLAPSVLQSISAALGCGAPRHWDAAA